MDEQELMARFEMVQQALQRVDAQLAHLEDNAMDLRRAMSTLEALGGKQEALIPIGGGVHVRAHVEGDQPIVSPIGRGYAADRDKEGARQDLQKRLEEAEQAIQAHAQEAERLAAAARQIASQLQSSS